MKNKTFFKLNLIYFVAISSVALVFLLGYLGIIKNDILSSLLIQIVVMVAIPMLMYSLMFKRNPKQTLEDCGFKKISAKMLGISIVLGIVLYFLNSFVANAFQSFVVLFGYERIGSSSTTTLTYGLLLKEFILSAILPGVCEEFLHRGIMLHTGKKTGNPRLCLFTSSLLFGLIHLNINQFFYAAILGFLMGYASFVSDSIYPAIIAHFMNNFLSNYFFYGTYLNLPLAKFVNTIENLILNNFLAVIIFSVIGVFALLYAYKILVRKLSFESIKRKMQQVINQVNMNKISIEEAQLKLNHMNSIIREVHKGDIFKAHNQKFSLLDKTFLISSIVLGSLITLSSFIWGII